MEKIKITFLGTGSAIPTPKRNHPATLISFSSESILIDCGENTQVQFKKAHISPNKITKILISHWHGDHTLGLLGLFQTLSMSDYKKQLEIYGPKNTKKYLRILSDNFLGGYNTTKIKTFDISNKKFSETSDFFIESLPLKHGQPTNGYSIILKEKTRLSRKKIKSLKLPNSPILKNLILGKSIKHEGKTITSKQVCYKEPEKKITYILDTEDNSNIIKLAKNCDLLIIESSFLDKDREQAKAKKHLTAKQAATIAKKAKVKTLALIHISNRYENNLSEVLKEAKKIFKNTIIPNDLDQIII